MSKTVPEVVDELVELISSIGGQINGLRTDRSTPILNNMRRVDVSQLLIGDEWFVFGDVTPSVLWPIDCAFALKVAEDRMQFRRARSISPKEVRGKARIVAPHMLRVDLIDHFTDGKQIAALQYLAYVGGRFVDVETSTISKVGENVQFAVQDPRHLDGMGRACIGVALRHRYEWSVSIGEPGRTSFRFPTDCIGVQTLIKERDKGETGRRASLRTWISDHWRQSRADENAETYVRQHMRGAQRFTWRGYDVELLPSAFDLERNAILGEDRKRMGDAALRKRQQ